MINRHFALGECFWGAGKDSRKVIALTLGTGLGSCFIDSHKVVTDREDVPAEGNVYNLPFKGGIADEMFSTRWIVRRFKELTGKSIKGALDVVNEYADEPKAKQLFNEYGERLAEFTSPLIRKFDCRSLLLGGNIAGNPELFGPAMKEEYRKKGIEVKIVLSEMLDKAAILGSGSAFI